MAIPPLQSYNFVMDVEHQEQPRTRIRRPIHRSGFAKFIYVCIGIYFGLLVFLFMNERFLVYPGAGPHRGNWNPDFQFTEVQFESQDGTQLVGWYLPVDQGSDFALICHGNAENVAMSAAGNGRKVQQALNANVFVFDYRGYGKSKGEPFEEGVLQDAEAALEWLNQYTGTTPNDIIYVGHSIGGGPAVHLAAKFGGKALLLQRTFGSIVEPAQSTYWFVPVNLLMRNRYPSSEKIKQCFVPLHQSHGDRDNVVPIWSGRSLYDRSPAPIKQFFINRGKGHYDRLPTEYWKSVRLFLQQVNDQLEASSEPDPVPAAARQTN